MYFFRTTVRLGDLDLNPKVKDGASPIDILIDRVITHERYLQDKKQINDIAILKLKDDVIFNSKLKKIILLSYKYNHFCSVISMTLCLFKICLQIFMYILLCRSYPTNLSAKQIGCACKL